MLRIRCANIVLLVLLCVANSVAWRGFSGVAGKSELGIKSCSDPLVLRLWWC